MKWNAQSYFWGLPFYVFTWRDYYESNRVVTGYPKGLQEHLADIEDRQSQIIEDFIIKNSDEHREYTAEFKNYLFCLRELVDKSKEVAGKDNAMPIVTIGTLVTVMNVANQREFAFHIVGPNYNRKNSRDVSCLSPVGRALMLKKVEDEVLVNAQEVLLNIRLSL